MIEPPTTAAGNVACMMVHLRLSLKQALLDAEGVAHRVRTILADFDRMEAMRQRPPDEDVRPKPCPLTNAEKGKP